MPLTLEGSPDFIIYFDNSRMDGFVNSFNSNNSVNGSISQAAVELVLLPELEYGVEYLTELRIFVKNMFTGKYLMVYEGEICNRSVSWSPSSGSIVFTAKDYLNWLNKVPVPVFFSTQQQVNALIAFTWAAQNIDIDKVPGMGTSEEMEFVGKNIHDIKEYIFNLMNCNESYTDPNGVLRWANLYNRMSIMGEIDRRLFQATSPLQLYLDSSDMSNMYTLFYSVAAKLSFEIYQDRDGMIRVKQPYWYEGIPYNHIIDSAIMLGYSESKNWEAEPTRILVQGGINEYLKQAADQDETMRGILTPVGLFYAPEDIPQNPVQANDPKYIGSWVTGSDTWNPGTDTSSEVMPGSFYICYDISPDNDIFMSNWGEGRNGGRTHEGIDLAYPRGTQIYAQGGASIVTWADLSIQDPYGFGNFVETRCLEAGMSNVYFLYAHLDTISVKRGDTVYGGQVIGTCGSSGNADDDAPHLHFAIEVGENKFVPPLNWFANPTNYPNRTGSPLVSGGKPVGNYKDLIQITDRERKYGVQLYQTSQPILRAGTEYQLSEKQGAYSQLHRYASYLNYAMKSASFTASLSLVGAPWLRPGFNLWIDPVGLDKIFYVETVNHSGTYSGGVSTNVGLSYGRDRRTFLMNKWFKLGKNVFLSDEDYNLGVDNFVDKSVASQKSSTGRTDMAAITESLRNIRNISNEGKLINITTDKNEVTNPYYGLYREHPVTYDAEHFTRWDYELTPMEIQLILDARFKSMDVSTKNKAVASTKISDIARKAIKHDYETLVTPEVVYTRAKSLKACVEKAKTNLSAIFSNFRSGS